MNSLFNHETRLLLFGLRVLRRQLFTCKLRRQNSSESASSSFRNATCMCWCILVDVVAFRMACSSSMASWMHSCGFGQGRSKNLKYASRSTKSLSPTRYSASGGGLVEVVCHCEATQAQGRKMTGSLTLFYMLVEKIKLLLDPRVLRVSRHFIVSHGLWRAYMSRKKNPMGRCCLRYSAASISLTLSPQTGVR